MGIFIIVVIAVIVYLWIKETDSSNKSTKQSSMNQETSNQMGWESTWKASAKLKRTGKCGENVSWSFYEDGQLIITGNGSMKDYKPETWEEGSGVAPWYPYRFEIRSVKIGKGITYLGDWAFVNCRNMKDIILGCNISKINWGTFADCQSLENIVIPKGVTKISMDAFSDCISMKTISLPDGVIEIGESAFYGCSNLTEVNLPNTLTDIDAYAFAFCNNLTRINISRKVSYIHEKAFYKSGINVSKRG